MRRVDTKRPELLSWLRAQMALAQLDQPTLAARLGHSNNGLVSYILRGVRRIPLDAIEDWARALRLEPRDAVILRTLVGLSHAPDFLVQEYWEYRDSLGKALAKLERLEARVDAYDRKVR